MAKTVSSQILRSTKTKKSQLPLGIALFTILAAIGIFLTVLSPKLSFFWLTGIAFGFILQKSRFCFTAAVRDPYLLRNFSLTRAVLIALAITTLGFTLIKYGAFINGKAIPGQDYIAPISFAAIVGGLMFGVGMVISGGCASGTLMRVGEGFTLQMITLFFFIVGALWGTHDLKWWKPTFIDKGSAVFLPDIFGWFGAAAIQLLLIGALYIATIKLENREQNY